MLSPAISVNIRFSEKDFHTCDVAEDQRKIVLYYRNSIGPLASLHKLILSRYSFALLVFPRAAVAYETKFKVCDTIKSPEARSLYKSHPP